MPPTRFMMRNVLLEYENDSDHLRPGNRFYSPSGLLLLSRRSPTFFSGGKRLSVGFDRKLPENKTTTITTTTTIMTVTVAISYYYVHV